MNTVKLTDDEKKLIINALMYVYDKKLDVLDQNCKVMTDEEAKWLLLNANKYFDVIDKIK
jgi:hypothetical protein